MNPRREELKSFPRPARDKREVGGTLDVDSKGNPWATSRNGAIKMDAVTSQYTHYEGPPAPEGYCGSECGGWGTYGITIDKDDNAWVTNPGLDRLLKVDSRTGKVTAVNLGPLATPEVLVIDRQRQLTLRGSQNGAVVGQRAPRRLAADPNADRVWVALYTGDRLARIDTKTLQVKEYPLPTPYSSPYATAVDKRGVVWITTMNNDVLTKFDPKTERFTEYPLPTRGTEIRHVQVDNRTDPPTVWAPYNRTNKSYAYSFERPPLSSRHRLHDRNANGGTHMQGILAVAWRRPLDRSPTARPRDRPVRQWSGNLPRHRAPRTSISSTRKAGCPR